MGNYRLLREYPCLFPFQRIYLCLFKLRPKPAFYAIARELKKVTVGIQREVNHTKLVLHIISPIFRFKRTAQMIVPEPFMSSGPSNRSREPLISGLLMHPCRLKAADSNSARLTWNP